MNITTDRDASAVRIASQIMAHAIQMNADQIDRVGTLAVQATESLLKRAGSGTLLISEIDPGANPGIEILALEHIESRDSLERAGSSRGTSTGGLLPFGNDPEMAAMRANSDEFEAFLPVRKGAAVLMRVWRSSAPMAESCFGAAWATYPGQIENGDLWAIDSIDDGSLTLLVSDGLGHGPIAASASHAALLAFSESPRRSPTEHLVRCHDTLRDTCGAVIAVAKISSENRSILFAGIGNISAAVLDETGTRRLMSHDGVVGHRVRKNQEFRLGLADVSLLIMHTDGIKSSWDLGNYPGLFRASPAIISAILLRDFSRGSDDACVVVLRC